MVIQLSGNGMIKLHGGEWIKCHEMVRIKCHEMVRAKTHGIVRKSCGMVRTKPQRNDTMYVCLLQMMGYSICIKPLSE